MQQAFMLVSQDDAGCPIVYERAEVLDLQSKFDLHGSHVLQQSSETVSSGAACLRQRVRHQLWVGGAERLMPGPAQDVTDDDVAAAEGKHV
jgi:hypothetical protein